MLVCFSLGYELRALLFPFELSESATVILRLGDGYFEITTRIDGYKVWHLDRCCFKSLRPCQWALCHVRWEQRHSRVATCFRTRRRSLPCDLTSDSRDLSVLDAIASVREETNFTLIPQRQR